MNGHVWVKKWILVFLMLATVFPLARAVSISPGKVELNFYEPNKEYTFQFTVDRTPKINVTIEKGPFSDYVQLDDPDPHGGQRTVTVHFKMPPKIDTPGKQGIYVVATEVALESHNVGGVAAVRAPIYFYVPYPGIYVEAQFNVNNVNEGEPVNFEIKLNNLGQNDISNARATIDVYEDGTKIKALSTEQVSIPTKTIATLHATLPTTTMVPGHYKAVATISYDGQTQTPELYFNIGTLYIAITNYTRSIEMGKIDRIDIEVESRWNNLINDVYSEVTINGSTPKSPNFNIDPWEKKWISTYYESVETVEGDYDMTITLRYEGKTTTETEKIHIGRPPEAKAPETQKPGWMTALSPVTLLIIIIVILLIADAAWLVMRRQKAPHHPKK